MLKKFLKLCLILTSLFIGIAITAVGYLFFKSNSSLVGELKFDQLDGPVFIHRDANGVTYIQAEKSDKDAFFALGFAHAQDRFWQMEFQRRLVQGKLSEIFGKETLTKDKY